MKEKLVLIVRPISSSCLSLHCPVPMSCSNDQTYRNKERVNIHLKKTNMISERETGFLHQSLFPVTILRSNEARTTERKKELVSTKKKRKET